MLARLIILFIVILIIYYIYDRNIIILEKLTLDDFNKLIQKIFLLFDNIFNNTYINENFNNYKKPNFNINIDNNVYSQLPEINCLSNLFSNLYDLSIKYNKDTFEFSSGINVKLEYYFISIQNQCVNVFNDNKPNLQMSYLLDIQHKILKLIHDFIFITHGSELPQELLDLENSFKQCFKLINNKLTTFNNSKFIYNTKDNNKINTNSGFIEYPNEPLPKNTYYDNYNFY